MKKVAIVTIESMNFGNRLQNYALQELLQSLGCKTETLHRITPQKGIKDRCKCLVQNLLQNKAAKFRWFNHKIEFSEIVIAKDVYPKGIGEEYDLFVAGSDQVWNPHYDFVAGECDFLMFAPYEKRIAYAPSFGVSEIPDQKKEYFADRLSKFAYLSVREQAGADIIYDLTGRRAEVVLDPTLMIGRKKWERVMRKSKHIPKEKYVMVYALGEKSPEFQSAIEYYSTQYKIFDIEQKLKNGLALPLGPAEFLFAIHNAEVVLTDSFHCTVFSVIFEKKVYTFDRQGLAMNSRIKTLQEALGIVQSDYRDIKIDYQDVKIRLKALREISSKYLISAIGEGDATFINNL